MRALRGIRLTHIGWTAYQNLNLVLEFHYEALSCIEDQMDALLSRDPANKGKHRHRIVQLLEFEVFLLEHSFCSNMIWSYCV